MDAQQTRIVDKVKKLLSLAQSANEHEAKSAADMASKIMVEHNLSVVADLSDHITVLTRGRVLAEGNYAMVSTSPQVREAYLGVGHE